VRYAIKAFVICLLCHLSLRVNVFLLKRFCNDAAVGQYSIASQVGDVLWMFPFSVAMVLFPRLVRDRHSRWSTALRNLGMVAAIMVVSCGLCALVARPFITAVYGKAFLPAVEILLWILPGVFFYALTSVIAQYLAAIGIPRVLLAFWVLTMLLVTAGGCLLIPRYAGVGAAIAFSIAFTLMFFMELGLAAALHSRTGPAVEPARQPAEIPEALLP
jgi:O-antigen/teichoic acid export membrane protein